MTHEQPKQNSVLVFSTQHEMEARMVQELLFEAGIESVIVSEMAPGLVPLNLGELATQQIYVLEPESERARQVIAEQHESGVELAEGSDPGEGA